MLIQNEWLILRKSYIVPHFYCSTYIMMRGRENRTYIKKPYFLLFSPWSFSNLFIRHNMCRFFNDRKVPGNGEYFLSLAMKNPMTSSVFFPFNERYTHRQPSFSHFPMMVQCRTYMALWSYKINDNQKCFPFGADLVRGPFLQRGGLYLHW